MMRNRYEVWSLPFRVADIPQNYVCSYSGTFEECKDFVDRYGPYGHKVKDTQTGAFIYP